MFEAQVHRLSMAHPGDLSELAALFASGTLDPAHVLGVIGKTEGNGGTNDFTRGYFTFAFATLLGELLDETRESVMRRVPCVLSGGTEGVLSPHYLVLARRPGRESSEAKRLAIGVAFSRMMESEEIGRAAQIEAVAATAARAMKDAGIEDPNDVRFVQAKVPCLTAVRAAAAARRGGTVVTSDAARSMAYARVAGAFGVAKALGEPGADAICEEAMLRRFDVFSSRASISSGVEVECNEIVVLGNASGWGGDLRIASRPMADALDLAAVADVLADLGVAARPQLEPAAAARIRGVLVKCEPDRTGFVRGHRHTMLDDIDINAQRHIRAAVGGLVAGVVGDGRIFVSGGAENQGPDGGGLIAVIAAVT